MAKSKHWTRTREGRRRLKERREARAAAQKQEAIAQRSAAREAKKHLRSVVRGESHAMSLTSKRGSRSSKSRRSVVIVSSDSSGLSRNRYEITTWGQLLDILTTQYADSSIESVSVDSVK